MLTLLTTSTADWALMFGICLVVCAAGVVLKFDEAGLGVVPGGAAVCAVIALFMIVVTALGAE